MPNATPPKGPSLSGAPPTGAQSDARKRRLANFLRASAAALAARGVAVLVTFVSVPLTVGYLGPERYGAWVTISTILAWFTLADIGIGNGLTNAVAGASAQGNHREAQAHIATAIWLLTGIACVLSAAVAAFWPFLDWASLLGVNSGTALREIGPAVAVALATCAAGIPLSVLEKIYAARQEGALANYWSAAGNLASLAAIVAVTRTQGGLVALVAAYSGARLVLQAISGAWLFVHHAPELAPLLSAVRRASIRRLATSGGAFFLIQIAALIIFNTDNVIIARILGARWVTPYSVSWSLFTLPTLVVTLAAPYLWPAYTEAIARGDIVWVRKTFRASLIAGTGISVAAALPLVLLGQWIIRIWAGPEAVPAQALLNWMGAWAIVLAPSQAVACFLNATGHLRGQMIYGTTAAAMNIVLSIALARSHGISGVIAATVISWILCGAMPAALEAARVMRRLRSDASA